MCLSKAKPTIRPYRRLSAFVVRILSAVSLPPPHSSSSSRAQHLIPTRRKAEEDDTTIQKDPCCIDVASFHPAATSD
jgi:hypothetical protein